MTASDIILQFATSEGGSFRKNELMSHMEGGPFSFAYIDLALNRMVKSGKGEGFIESKTTGENSCQV